MNTSKSVGFSVENTPKEGDSVDGFFFFSVTASTVQCKLKIPIYLLLIFPHYVRNVCRRTCKTNVSQIFLLPRPIR